jgi:hypothetical protein
MNIMKTTRLRKYNISIIAQKNAPKIADNVLKDFDCEISEPSAWLLPGTTNEKGLSFLDKKGNPLNSPLFKNQAYFHVDTVQAQTEEEAVELLIYTILFDCYTFGKSDAKVIVTKCK